MSTMHKNVPLAANPKSAMLITMKDRWFHCPMENTRVSKTSKASVEKDTKKMALRSIVGMDRVFTNEFFFDLTGRSRPETVLSNKCIGIYSGKSIVTYFSIAHPVIGTNSTPVICRVE